MVTAARVLTFYVEEEQIPNLLHELDTVVVPRFEQHPGFRGLLCLEEPDGRSQVLAISLWDGSGMEDTEGESERIRRLLIEASGTHGIATRHYRVLRAVPDLEAAALSG